MLSKANGKIELFWALHSEALVFSCTERPFVWTISWNTFCLFYMRWLFATKVGKTPPIKLWHHDTKRPFWGCDNHFSLEEMCVFNGIRNAVVKFTDCVGLPWVWNDEWIGKSAFAGCKLTTSVRMIFVFSLIHEPYNKQHNSLDRSVVTGKSQTSAFRIELAIGRSIRQGLSLRYFPVTTSLLVI